MVGRRREKQMPMVVLAVGLWTLVEILLVQSVTMWLDADSARETRPS